MALDATIGGQTADTYATLAEFQAYTASMGLAVSASDPEMEAGLRRALLYMDQSYHWAGSRAGTLQALAWPRSGVPGVDGVPVSADAIPSKVKRAQMEMAFLIVGGTNPFAVQTGGEITRKREKVDVIEEETEYSSGAGKPTYPSVDGLLRGYARGKVGSGVGSVSMVRV